MSPPLRLLSALLPITGLSLTPKLESTTGKKKKEKKKKNSLETVPDFYASGMLSQHSTPRGSCCCLRVAQVGDALWVMLLPQLFLLDCELLRLV